MRALAYIRVSTDDQLGAGNSPEVQRDRIRSYAALYGIEIVGEVSDLGVSSGVPLRRREGGAELTRRMIAGEVDGCVVADLDRLFRDAFEGLGFFRWCADHDLHVHSVADRIDTGTPEGKLTLGIKLCTAQFERDKTRQRTKATMRYLAEQGRVRGGVPYACVDRVGSAKRNGEPVRMLERDPALWPQRVAIVAMRASGMSLAAIAARLQADGVPAPDGGATWAKSTVRRIVETHSDLEHIPMAGDGAAEAPALS